MIVLWHIPVIAVLWTFGAALILDAYEPVLNITYHTFDEIVAWAESIAGISLVLCGVTLL